MEGIDNGTTDNTNNGTESGTTGNETTSKSLPTGDSPNKSLEEGEDSGKSLDEGEDPHKTLPTRDHETKKINESEHETKANDKAYEEPKEEVKAESAFNLEYFDKPEEASPEVTEKASELINGDLNYFDNWVTEAEDQKKQNKEQLDAYLKSNVESGNQLAYTGEDLTAAQQNLQNAKKAFDRAVLGNTLINIGDIASGNSFSGISGYTARTDQEALAEKDRDLRSNAYGNSTSKEEILQKIREKHPVTANNIGNNLLDIWAENVVNYNEEKQIREDLGRNGSTVNSGITKAQETDLMNRAASDYSSLSDAEKEMVGKVVDAVAANPNALNQPLEPGMPFETPRDRQAREERNRARAESNQRLRENVSAVKEAREAGSVEAERREAERARAERRERDSETSATSTRTTSATPTRTEATSSETPSRTEETPSETETRTSTDESETPETETPATETTTEEPESETAEPESETAEPESETAEPETSTSSDDVIAKADEAKAAYEEAKKRQYEAMRREADETEIAQLAAEVSRLKREWDEAEAEAGPLRPREEGEEEPKKPRIGHGSENRELSREETLPEWVGGDDPHDSSAGAYWAGAFGDENWAEKLPEDTVKGLINYANDHHDNPIAMFGMTALMDSGGYDALKAGRDFQEMVAAAKQVASHTSTAIDNFKNGNIKEGIKSLLEAGKSAFVTLKEAISSAWNVCKAGLSFIVSIFAPVRSAISSFIHTKEGYNAVRDMIRNMYGIENSNEVIQEIFGDDSNTETKTAPVNVLNKTGFSVKGGTITDESSYNKGMKEKENDIVSDVCKKTMLYFPYLRKVMR